MSRDEKVKAMMSGKYDMSVRNTRNYKHPVSKRPTDPTYPKPKEVIGMGQAFVIKYECECGAWVPEKAKRCESCKRVNMDWIAHHFNGLLRNARKEED